MCSIHLNYSEKRKSHQEGKCTGCLKTSLYLIGKKGQNSRLAARLCGVKIDIHTKSDEVAESDEDELEEGSAFQDTLDERENAEKNSDSFEVEESAFAGLGEDNE